MKRDYRVVARWKKRIFGQPFLVYDVVRVEKKWKQLSLVHGDYVLDNTVIESFITADQAEKVCEQLNRYQ